MKKNVVLEYIDSLPAERREALNELRKVILANLPKGFAEVINYNMPGYVVPHSIYPAGYHCDPKLPLPFIAFASQKNFIALYHMGIYADKKLHDWFVNEYTGQFKVKLDMGKSCIRFKKMDQIPYALIGELVAKVSLEDWIGVYEKNVKREQADNG